MSQKLLLFVIAGGGDLRESQVLCPQERHGAPELRSNLKSVCSYVFSERRESWR
jgi:hypothetical protein